MFSEDNYLNIRDPVELILSLQLNEISRNHERVPIYEDVEIKYGNLCAMIK